MTSTTVKKKVRSMIMKLIKLATRNLTKAQTNMDRQDKSKVKMLTSDQLEEEILTTNSLRIILEKSTEMTIIKQESLILTNFTSTDLDKGKVFKTYDHNRIP